MKTLVRLEFLYNLGRLPDLKNPKTLNEKIQWIKLYDRNPLMTLVYGQIRSQEDCGEQGRGARAQ